MGWASKLRLHESGQYFFRHAKSDHYCGKDKGGAEAAFRAYFAALKGAKAGGATEPHVLAQRSRKGASTQAPGAVVTVTQAADHLMVWADRRRTTRTSKTERHRLSPFLATFGSRRLDSLSIAELSEWATSLRQQNGRELSPKSLNHHLQAVRRLLGWAYDAGHLSQPYRLATLAPVPIPPPKPKAMKPERVRELVKLLYGLNPNLGKLFLLGFWAALRPSEIGRVVARAWYTSDTSGGELPEGCYRLQVSKTRHRVVILTPEALTLLEGIQGGYGTTTDACKYL